MALDVDRVQDSIRKRIAYLPGGSDRVFSRILVFGDQGESGIQSYETVLSVTTYLAQVAQSNVAEPSNPQSSSAYARTPHVKFTVVIDMRRGWIKYLKVALKALQHALYPNIRQVLIIKPEKLLEKQRLFVDIVLEGYEFKVTMVSMHKLSRYIDVSQLPLEFGGTFPYDAEVWINLRQRYENFLLHASKLLRQLRRTPAEVANEDVGTVVRKGDGLLLDLQSTSSEEELSELRRPVNPEHHRAASRINTILAQIKAIQEPPEDATAAAQQQQLSEAQLEKQFMHGVENMLDWFLNAGERWLLTLHEIGESTEEAEQLCKEHETLRIKANEVLSKVGEVNTLADRLTGSGAELGDSVDDKRKHLDSVARTFMARVRRQADMCALSVQLHAVVAEHSRKLDDLLQVLVSEIRADDVQAAEEAIDALEQQLQTIDASQEEVLAAGERLLEQLTITEYNCLGQEVTRDYVAALAHVRQLLADTVSRRRRSADLVDVRRLKLQQSLQLRTCERDCQQSIAWLAELHDNLRTDFSGPTDGSDEAARQRRVEQSKLEHTARKTHDYGLQLAQNAEGLRRSLRLPLGPHQELLRQLNDEWASFCRTLADSDAKIRMSRTFHAAAKDIGSRIDELRTEVVTTTTTVGDEPASAFRPVQPAASGTSGRIGKTGPGGSTILPNGFAMANSNKSWATSLPDFSETARGQANPVVNSQRRRLAGDVRELRHMASLLTTSTAGVNQHSPAQSADSGDSASYIRALLDQIELKQRQLDLIIGDEDN